MKILRLLWRASFIIFSVVLSNSCKPQYEDIFITDKLVIGEGDQVVNFETSSASIKDLIFSTNTNWVLKVDKGWASVSQKKGTSGNIVLQVSVNENKELIERTAVILLRSGRLIRNISIVQAQKNSIVVEQEESILTKDAQKMTVAVQANVAVEVSVLDNVDWITLLPQEGGQDVVEYVFNVSVNPTTEIRKATILFSNTLLGVSDTLSVTQYDASYIDVPADKYDIDCKEQKLYVDVNTNLDVEAIIPEATTWVSYDSKETNGELTTFCFNINNNIGSGRTTQLSFRNEVKEITKAITLNQEAFYTDAVVTFTTTGLLTAELDKISGDMTSYTKLTVNGAAMNAADFNAIKAKLTNIVVLDISRTLTTTIPATQFQKSKLQKISFPKTITTFESNAFNACDLVEIKVPATITTWGVGVFSLCPKLKYVEMEEGLKSVGFQAFAKCPVLETAICASTIEHWDEDASKVSQAFVNSTKLRTVVLPEGMKSMGVQVFQFTAIENLRIPSTVSWVNTASGQNKAFADIKVLTQVDLADGLTTLGGNLFAACTGLLSINCESAVPPVVTQSSGNGGLGSGLGALPGLKIYVPKGSLAAYQTAPIWSFYKSKIVERK